jgi:formylmethanofuran dehydrogenase subunit E
MKSLDEYLKESYSFHGENCPGQVIGTRMAIVGCREIGLEDPKSDEQRKKIIVYVEMDRCATDAIMAVTGCRPGKRTLKIVDYGIMAATFINLDTGKAVRVVAREEARSLASKYAPEITEKYNQQREAYKIMPEEELFKIEEVTVEIPPEDMPGKTLRRVRCERCGDYVQDCKEVRIDRQILCKPCALGGYFKRLHKSGG